MIVCYEPFNILCIIICSYTVYVEEKYETTPFGFCPEGLPAAAGNEVKIILGFKVQLF